ncbi:MAG: hypothetical protein J6W04_02675 [Bacteroidales bacterium]|nr:hypothetical protein [Bacteroidales bacterium]
MEIKTKAQMFIQFHEVMGVICKNCRYFEPYVPEGAGRCVYRNNVLTAVCYCQRWTERAENETA